MLTPVVRNRVTVHLFASDDRTTYQLVEAIRKVKTPTEELCLRPLSVRKLRTRKLRIADSEIPGNSLWTWEFHPLKLRTCLSQTLLTPDY